MNCLPLVLYLMSLLHPVLSSLPAPVNLSVSSVNFHHVLHWDPGPGTPPGTQYKIFRKSGKNKCKLLTNSTATSVKLNLKFPRETYKLVVEASYNKTRSNQSKYTFTPYEQTIIGPPTLSLAGCGNCIQINISMPEADRRSGINDIHSFYGVQYIVRWKKFNGELEKPYKTGNKSFTLSNLQNGTEYCVQVYTRTRQNKNTEPSAWTCTYTSTVEASRVPVILGTVVALLILVFGSLMTFMLCLHYTGFICQLKATLPRALMVLSHSYTPTPESTITDQISISPKMEKQRRHNNPTVQHREANSEDEEEEEEEERINIYMDRDAGLSCSESSCQNSSNVSGNRTLAASGDSGTVEMEEPEFEVAEEGKADVAELSFIPERGQTGVQGHVTGVSVEEEEEEEEVFDSSGNVDLFSVKLASLPVCEEEEVEEEEEEEQKTRDSLADLLNLSNLDLTVSQPVSDDQTVVARMLPTQKDCTGRRADTLSGYLKTCDDETQHEQTQEDEEEGEEEEEEEEEEFSGYVRHM